MQRASRSEHASASASELAGGSTAADAFRNHMIQLYVKNKFSAPETVALARAATMAGAAGIADFGRVGQNEADPTKNAARDLMAKMLKGCSTPPLYWCTMPLYNKNTNMLDDTDMPVLLPHEVFASIVTNEHITDLLACKPEIETIRKKVCASLGLDPTQALAIGIHGDGVPHQKRKSIEVLSWNFLSDSCSKRILFCLIEKDCCCKCGCGGRHTLEKFLEIFSWSVRCMIEGKHPSTRHDGSQFTSKDASRAKQAGKDLPAKAVLLQVRGDWSWYKQVFSFPSWSSSSICWLCGADKARIPFTDFSLTAAWRRARYAKGEFWRKLRDQNLEPSCLFSIPGMSLEYVCIDVLHALDLGITQDALGNAIWEFMNSGAIEGRTQQARLSSLWMLLKSHYKTLKTPNQLQGLTLDMLKRPGKGPRLRAKGAETRGVVSFAVECATALHEHCHNTHSLTVLKCISSLMDFYLLMMLPKWHAPEAASACRQFCLLYAALRAEAAATGDDQTWRIKPKMHLFAELAEFQAPWMGNPSAYWNYADEDFVGWVAGIASSRGGPTSAASTAKRTLERYRIAQSQC